jgi:F-type H+-transporting ATPase subunit a
VSYDEAGNVVNKKPLDLSITKMVFSMFLSMLLLILIFVATARTYSKSKKGEPTGLGKFTEPLVMFIKDEVALPMIGEKKLPEIYAISFNTIFLYMDK